MENKQSVTIMACGDMMFGDFYFNIGLGVGSKIRTYGADYLFEKCQPIFNKADLLIGNLECPISLESSKSGIERMQFLASPAIIESIVNAGFNYLNVANNHISQHGYNAFIDTLQLLEQHNITPIGVKVPQQKKQTPAKFTVGSFTISLLSYSYVEDHFEGSPHYYAYKPDENDITSEIRDAKKTCDKLIVYLHWGDEFVHHPSTRQKELGRSIIDAGADLVIGSHPHVLQPIEKYKNGIIAYSLGNFIFDMKWPPSRYSIILEVVFNIDGTQDLHTHPIWINENYCPVFIDEDLVKIQKPKINEILFPNDLFFLSDDEYNKLVCLNLGLYQSDVKENFLKDIKRLKPSISLSLLLDYFKRHLVK